MFLRTARATSAPGAAPISWRCPQGQVTSGEITGRRLFAERRQRVAHARGNGGIDGARDEPVRSSRIPPEAVARTGTWLPGPGWRTPAAKTLLGPGRGRVRWAGPDPAAGHERSHGGDGDGWSGPHQPRGTRAGCQAPAADDDRRVAAPGPQRAGPDPVGCVPRRPGLHAVPVRGRARPQGSLLRGAGRDLRCAVDRPGRPAGRGRARSGRCRARSGWPAGAARCDHPAGHGGGRPAAGPRRAPGDAQCLLAA